MSPLGKVGTRYWNFMWETHCGNEELEIVKYWVQHIQICRDKLNEYLCRWIYLERLKPIQNLFLWCSLMSYKR